MTTSSALGSSPTPRDLFTESVAQLTEASRQEPFDAVIVGGGTAGVVAALTLAERGQRALCWKRAHWRC